MRHSQNTLYLTKPDTYVSKEGNTLIVEVEHVKVQQLPVHIVNQIVCFGYNIVVSAPLMAYCMDNGISVGWFDDFGRFLARVEGAEQGNVLLRREQYRIADDPERSLLIAKCIAGAKVVNQRNTLLRYLRNYPEAPGKTELEENIERLSQCLKHIKTAADKEILRGYEGEAGRCYFAVFDHLIVSQKESFIFKNRNRRPPLDKVNALLSFVYGLLMHDVKAALCSVGLDAFVGMLHTERPGRPSLALDIMEEFRAAIADRVVLNLINLKQVEEKGFEQLPTGEVLMKDDTRRAVITAYQNRKKEVVKHPFLEEEFEIGLFFLLQARLLARHIRKDIEFYPAFIWR